MSYLVDTNVFLEVLLNQPGRPRCEAFLKQHAGDVAITDFSLHSVGVVAFRRQRPALFGSFLADSLPNLALLHLDRVGYPAIWGAHCKFGLDFDDAYQFTVAKGRGLTLVTQNHDFDRVQHEVAVCFL